MKCSIVASKVSNIEGNNLAVSNSWQGLVPLIVYSGNGPGAETDLQA